MYNRYDKGEGIVFQSADLVANQIAKKLDNKLKFRVLPG